MKAMLRIILLVLISFSSTSSAYVTENMKGNFEVRTHDGKKFTHENLKGKYSLLYFGFTFCPDICPSTLNEFAQIYSKLPQDIEEKIQILFVTVDPTRDTEQKMKEYMSNFDNRMIGLTGTEKQVESMAHLYKVYYEKLQHRADPDNYMLDHSTIVYFINDKGDMVYAFAHDDPSDKIAAEIKRIIKSAHH